MTKSTKSIIGAVIIIIVIIIAAFAIFHKSPAPATNSNQTASNTPVANDSIILTKTSPSLGQYLTDPNGRAIYTYNADSSGTSKCTGSCLATWPAYTANKTSASLPSGVTTIKRSDNGETQYAYNGMPLYYFVSDSNGQVTGDGVENFHVAKPTSAAQSGSDTTQPASPSSSSNSSSGYPY
jgi:predicted lipoprotein with Yx(FWY)xxD motif